MSLEEQIESQLNESEVEEQPQEREREEKKELVLPISGVVNSIFLFLSKDWSDEDRQKLILDDMESQNLNEMLTPIVLRVAEKLGLAVEEISALIGLAGLLLPRVLFLFMSLRKKYSKGEKENGVEREEKAGS